MNHNRRNAALLGTAMCLILSGAAQAVGTPAGTPVNNTATIGYSVGGVSQPNVASNTASFVVDKRINLTVAELGGAATTVSPGSSSQVTSFTVTNTTNGVADFKLTAAQDNGGTTAFGDTDDFNASNVGVFVDSNANGIYESALDTATFIDELAADASRTVFIVVDVPLNLADLSTAGVTLTATAAEPGTGGTLGGDSVQTAGADTPSAVDIVFGDTAGDTDAARDGRFSDDDEYDIATATITFLKTSRVVSDPFNGATEPKAIPGAVLEYCLAVSNSGSAGAADVAFTDAVPTNVTYVTGTLVAGGTISGGVCNADGSAEDDNDTGGDDTDGTSASFASNTVSASVSTVAAGGSTTARFRVTVN